MKLVFAFILLCNYFLMTAQSKLLPFDYQHKEKIASPIRHITDNGLNGINIKYHFESAMVVDKVEPISKRKAMDFQMISIPGFSHLQEVGLPALPVHIDLVAVPKGSSYSVENIKITKNKHQGYRIYPALKPALDTQGAPEPEFEMDEDFYKQDVFFPQNPVRIVEKITLRGMDFLLVEVVPVQYNPATSELYTITDVSYQIKFSSANVFFDYQNHSKAFIKTLLDLPLNSQGMKTDYKNFQNTKTKTISNTTNSKNYIIITQDAFLAAADSLAQWKQQLGYSTEVVSASSWTAANVKNAIHSRYQNWVPKPDYFVIIGDVQQVPTDLFTAPDASGTYGTDLYFACMDGGNDYVPEMARGRISVSSAAEAMMVVHKIINYERNPIVDSSFYQNAVNCAQFQDDDHDGYADRRFLHTSEDVRNYVQSQGYDVQRIYYADANVYPYHYNASYYSNGQSLPTSLLKTNGFPWNGGATDIKNAINAGKFYVLHRDHGYAGGYGWAHPYYVTSKISQLTNGSKLPVVFSINCHTGEFTLTNCFAEKFLRHANGGAVGVIAASYYSYSGYNDGFTVGMFDGIWSNPGLIPNFGSGGNANPNVSAHSDIENMGFVMDHGLMRMVQTWGGNTSGRIYTYRLFHYFGDPAMKMWTEQPDSITATHVSSIQCTDTALVISNCSDSNAVATLMGNGQLLGSATIINGYGYIPIYNIQGSNLLLTISARNKIPYTSHIAVASGGSLSLWATVNNNKCFGDSLGSIEVFPSCGNPPYLISWSIGSNSNRIDSLPEGDYIVAITDTFNSVLIDTIHVWAPPAPLQSAPMVKDAKCYFESSGRVDLNLSGGAQPYTYQWSNGSTSSYAQNLAAGNISVHVFDSVGCVFDQSFVINQPPPLDLTTSYTNDSTNNCVGTGTAYPTGGTPPYTYQWNDPNNQQSATAIGLCKGIYKISLRDSNQCLQYRTIFIDNTIGFEDFEDSRISIYPNPTSDKLYIDFGYKRNENLSIKMINVMGSLILNKTILENQSKIEVDVSKWSSGIYLLRIQGDKSIVFQKEIIIE